MKWSLAIIMLSLLGQSFGFGFRIDTPTQTAPAALVVSLRDADGSAISDVLVLVRDRSGRAELSRVTTDAAGMARFASLPVAEVRVAVQGQLPDGTPLVQPGADVRGVHCMLGIPPTRLDLRATADGRVGPDPATMITPDLGGTGSAPPSQGFPTLVPAERATTLPATIVPLIVAPTAPLPIRAVSDASGIGVIAGLVGMLLIGIALLALATFRRFR
jgi:hypothetical protein